MAERSTAQMPMKTSMKTLTVVVVFNIQPASYSTPASAARARISDSVMVPAATAAPSVFTTNPIQAAATSGSVHKKICAAKGSISNSTTEKTTTSDDTMI